MWRMARTTDVPTRAGTSLLIELRAERSMTWLLPRDHVEYRVFAAAARQLSHFTAITHHRDSVGDAHQFFHFRGNEEHCHALACQSQDFAHDLLLGGDVDAAGGFVQ